MAVAYDLSPTDLTDKSKQLADDLKAFLVLETSGKRTLIFSTLARPGCCFFRYFSLLIQPIFFFAGVVRLTMPPNPVFYLSNHTLTCSVREALGDKPVWQLRTDKELFNITSGSEANLIFLSRQTSAELKKISELWLGTSVSASLFTFQNIYLILRCLFCLALHFNSVSKFFIFYSTTFIWEL